MKENRNMLINERKLRSIVRSVIRESIGGGAHPVVQAMAMLAQEISSKSGGKYTLHVGNGLEQWPAVSKRQIVCAGRLEGLGSEFSVKMTPKQLKITADAGFEWDARPIMVKNIDVDSCLSGGCSSLASAILAKVGSGFDGKFSENNPELKAHNASHAPADDFDWDEADKSWDDSDDWGY